MLEPVLEEYYNIREARRPTNPRKRKTVDESIFQDPSHETTDENRERLNKWDADTKPVLLSEHKLWWIVLEIACFVHRVPSNIRNFLHDDCRLTELVAGKAQKFIEAFKDQIMEPHWIENLLEGQFFEHDVVDELLTQMTSCYLHYHLSSYHRRIYSVVTRYFGVLFHQRPRLFAFGFLFSSSCNKISHAVPGRLVATSIAMLFCATCVVVEPSGIQIIILVR